MLSDHHPETLAESARLHRRFFRRTPSGLTLPDSDWFRQRGGRLMTIHHQVNDPLVQFMHMHTCDVIAVSQSPSVRLGGKSAGLQVSELGSAPLGTREPESLFG